MCVCVALAAGVSRPSGLDGGSLCAVAADGGHRVHGGQRGVVPPGGLPAPAGLWHLPAASAGRCVKVQGVRGRRPGTRDPGERAGRGASTGREAATGLQRTTQIPESGTAQAHRWNLQ